jgi:hypothetical protein
MSVVTSAPDMMKYAHRMLSNLGISGFVSLTVGFRFRGSGVRVSLSASRKINRAAQIGGSLPRK